jgi:four helix bundle protein
VASYNHFYELPVYRALRAFRKKISGLVRKYIPKGESELKKQLMKSSRSFTANYAEGFGRFYYKENIQFCRTSRGSLTESMEHLITCYDEKYISRDMLKEAHRDYKKCLRELNGYLKYLKDKKESDNN